MNERLLYSFSPYYIWLGRPRSCDTSRFSHAFEIEGGNTVGNCSPATFTTVKETEIVPPLEIGEPVLAMSRGLNSDAPLPVATVIDITSPLSSFHYQVKNVRLIPLRAGSGAVANAQGKIALALAIL